MTLSVSGQHTAGASSILRYLGVTGIALWLLVMALQPDVGFTAPWLWMGLFWLLQISSGLFILQSLLFLLSRSRHLQTLPLWALVAASGVVGAALLTPLYWLIEELLTTAVADFVLTIDDDELETRSGFGISALLKEFADLAGPVTAAWCLISLPRLQGLLPPVLLHQVEKPGSTETTQTAEKLATMLAEDVTRPGWRNALPREMGDDVIAVKSELQYLRVWTNRGSTLVLGALQEVEDTEGQAGMRIHRSWWIHADHVRSVRRRADGLVCQLSDGREIPVSRRRKADVLARFGDAAHYRAATVSTQPSERSA